MQLKKKVQKTNYDIDFDFARAIQSKHCASVRETPPVLLKTKIFSINKHIIYNLTIK